MISNENYKRDVFPCNTCGRTFGRKDNLNRHQQSHRIPSFVCFVCSEAFSRQDTLQRHINFHLNTGNLLAPRRRRATSLLLPPSADCYLQNYTRYYNPHLPIIHRSTFVRLQEWPALFCSVLAIGALFSLDTNVAYHLYQTSLSQMPAEAEPSLQFLQAMHLQQAFALWMGSQDQFKEALINHSRYIKVFLSRNL